jgi:colanic acid/amylovoran biosynthesis glycosyltransferase
MRPPETAIAYILGTFPTPSQTFIAREVRGLLAAGVPLHIFSLRRRAASALEPADRDWFHRVRFVPLSMSASVLAANAYFLRRDPGRYASALRLLLGLPHRPRVLMVRAMALALVAAWIAREIKRAGGCRHVHAHFALAQAEVAMAAGALLGRPFSFTAHARDIYATPSALAEKMRAARFVVTVSQYNVEYLRRLCPALARERIQLVHCGVDTNASAHADADIEDKAPPLVLAAGRLIDKKGFDVLVAACGLLRDRGLTFRCRIVGDGPLRNALARAIRDASLDDVVELPGWLPAHRLLALLPRATVFVAPSRISASGDRDGIPTVVLEAMAARLPVVATDVSGIPEAVANGVTGLLVPAGDAAALADGLQRILIGPEAGREMGQAGRRSVLASFDLTSNSRRLAELFNARCSLG